MVAKLKYNSECHFCSTNEEVHVIITKEFTQFFDKNSKRKSYTKVSCNEKN